MENQAKYKKFQERLNTQWFSFISKRKEILTQGQRFGKSPEKLTENILTSLFTDLLDWDIKDLNYQVDYADIEITKLGIKRILIETKRPGGISWNHLQVQKHIEQALRYASKQKVFMIGISDGEKLYILNFNGSSTEPRIFISLSSDTPDGDLYYISINGIDKKKNTDVNFKKTNSEKLMDGKTITDELLNKQYKLPSRCFAYVGDPNKPNTWKLPYLLYDGSVNISRLPSAIGCIVTNFRGLQVKAIP